MGQLIAWHYPTIMFAKLADHTYVTCGNRGKEWSCWGGKTDGKILRQGTGSTKQANAIAEPDEKAGITCYLINGVCHQAANRILFPAKITVRGARGYSVSEALFGTYGRPRGFLGMCTAPFNQHNGVAGDLPECESQKTILSDSEKNVLDVVGDDRDEPYQAYLEKVTGMYNQVSSNVKSSNFTPADADQFQIKLFDQMVEYKLGDIRQKGKLIDVRKTIEAERFQLETPFKNKEVSVESFVEKSNMLDEKFQAEMANTLDEDAYQNLFELKRGDYVVLGDPEIAKKQYADGI